MDKEKLVIEKPKERKVYSRSTIKHDDKTKYVRKEKYKKDLEDAD